MGQKAWNLKQKQSLMLYNGEIVLRNKTNEVIEREIHFPHVHKIAFLLSFHSKRTEVGRRCVANH